MDRPVEITPSAVKEIRYILEKKNIPAGYGLRVTVKGGSGCAGVQFTLGFDQAKSDDISYQVDDIDVHIRKGEMIYLIGKKIDFYEGGDARGFVFQDQEESSTDAL